MAQPLRLESQERGEKGQGTRGGILTCSQDFVARSPWPDLEATHRPHLHSGFLLGNDLQVFVSWN